MKHVRSILLSIIGAALFAYCSGDSSPTDPGNPDPPPPPAPSVPDFAFINVNVVPMNEENVVTGQTVVIDRGKIVEMGPSSQIEVAPEVEQIDATGKYLMPGLSDMHTHPQNNATAVDDLKLFIIHGVTTIRVMWGSSRHLEWRNAIADGDIIGPTMFVASPGYDAANTYNAATVVTNANQVAPLITQHRSEGYDFIKIYNGLSKPVFDTIMDIAQNRGIKVIGHVPWNVGLDHALTRTNFHSIEHFIGFSPDLTNGAWWNNWDTSIDESQLNPLALKIKEAGIWVDPTITVNLKSRDQTDSYIAAPEMDYVSIWLFNYFIGDGNPQPPLYTQLNKTNLLKMLKALDAAEAPLIMGTDAGFFYTIPGWSMHDELDLYIEAGITPYRALKAATYNTGQFFEDPKHGVVAKDANADLILLDANPLTDVTNVRNTRLGVMVQGVWYSKETLDEMLAALKR